MKNSEEIKIKVILLIVGAFLGFVFGEAIGIMWYVFCALVLGWGDSAPDWYFQIQGIVQTTILVISIIAGIVGLQFLWNRAQRKKKGLAQ
ncbi:MAG: hypothetical protein HZB31_12610 [Nitrospirae bacterium]|nr:hypothetical protein [Nitrospirota bacterium]